ncbi:MAG: endonuclease/exonuclease/phosphatase family protein [Verrucomicrobiota bacterium]
MHSTVFLILALGLAAASCRRESSAPPKAVAVRGDGAIALRLMSFNVRYEGPGDTGSRAWPQRILGAVHLLQREAPDVIGVQELLHGQAADLRASMPEFGFHGVGRDDGERAGEYSGIFYRHDRLELDSTDCGTFWLSDTPEIVGSRTWGNEIPRVAAWCRFTHRASGRGFYVFNTHWDHRNQPSRERAALLIARRIDARRHAEESVVLLGDFNSVETNPGIAYLTGKTVTLAGATHSWQNGLIDVYQSLHPQVKNRRTLHLWRDSLEGSLKVDHILVSRGAKVEAAEIVNGAKPPISDHYPVTARVFFPAGK